MKIKKLEFSGHEVLGDLRIDFTDESGKPLDVVVFIGDNGTGKTKILETIVDVFKLCEISMTSDDETQNANIAIKKGESDTVISNELMTLVVNKGERVIEDSIKGSPFFTRWDNEPWKISRFDPEPLVIWMPAELDINKEGSGNEQKQSIIKHGNLWSLDDINDYIVKAIHRELLLAATKSDKLGSEIYENELKKINDVFKDLDLNVKLDRLSPGNNPIPLFKTNDGEEINIKQLSSGEKQLFFRLLSLKNLNVNNAIIIVDEPETSLHPEWQRKIIKIYQEIGKNNQIIIATHSPLIVGSVPTESVRIMSRNTVGEIEVHLADQTYGKSVEEIMSGVMDLNSLRDEATTKKIADVIKLLEDDKYDTEEYKSLMADLKEQLGTTDKDIIRIEMEKAIRMRRNAKSK